MSYAAGCSQRDCIVAVLYLSTHFEDRFEHSKSNGVVIIAETKLAINTAND